MPTPSRDRGDTLVEILVALAILGIAITAMVGALGAHVSTTNINRNQSQAESVLAAAAEHVKALEAFTFACPGIGSVTLTTAELPRDAAYSVAYGPAEAIDGQPCDRLVAVPVRVQGNGFDLTVRVVKRP